MRTELFTLRIGNAAGAVKDVTMRYNASHQRGYRCFIGPIADTPERIGEETPRSFEGRSLFDALAAYRAGIEPDGWRLLHAAARLDCWPKPEGFSPWVYRLAGGSEATDRVDGFEAATFEQVATLDEQRAHFDHWRTTLDPIWKGRTSS